MTTPRCGDCRFYAPLAGRDDVGECRRHAPVGMIYQESPVGVFPRVIREEWCGEFALPGERETVEEFIKARIALCGHGTISATCGPCVAAWLPR